MAIDVVLGLQRGDEGKGRFVDGLASSYGLVARFNGGPNAGHTIAHEDMELKLHQIPSGISYANIKNIIGNGSYVDPVKLMGEIEELKNAGVEITPDRLHVSSDAHMILPHHISLDEIREASDAGQGSTRSGIAYVARDKYERIGARTEQLADPSGLQKYVQTQLEAIQELRKAAKLPDQDPAKTAETWTKTAVQILPFVTDTFAILYSELLKDTKVLAEGAQATGLDIEHGMYPFVTSSHATLGGMLNGLGVGPKHVGKVIGVAKALRSHVGGGPFVTEEKDAAKAAALRGDQGKIDSEYGATTGRERRVGYLDLPELRRAIWVNGVTAVAITKLDVLPKLGPTIPVATSYTYKGEPLSVAPSSAAKLAECQPNYEQLACWTEDISTARKFQDLPAAAQAFIKFLEKDLGVPITMIGVGPYREQVIFR